jgi:hypothetical protein
MTTKYTTLVKIHIKFHMCLNAMPWKYVGGIEVKLHAFCMQVSGQLHALAALIPGKEHKVLIAKEIG